MLQLGFFDGAFYLADYSVECALKAWIAKGTLRGDFPDKKKVDSSHTHNLLQLMKLAGVDEESLGDFGIDAALRKNWEIVQSWSEQSRYRKIRPESAKALLAAVSNSQHGVIEWIQKRW